MDSDGLLTFLAVHRAGSVSAAAGVLSRTQSAISRRLALLEEQIGMPLFERVGRKLVMSDAGRTLLPLAERVAAAMDDARAGMERLRRGHTAILRIATVGTLADDRLTATLKAVRARHPDLDLQLRTATSDEVSGLVRAGEITIGLRYFTAHHPDLQMEVVANETLVVACSPDHRLAGQRVAALKQLRGERWLAFPVHERKGEHFARSVFAQFVSRGIVDLDWLAIDSLTAQKRLMEAGLGLALIQESAIREELQQQRLALIAVRDLHVEMPIVSVMRPGVHPGAAARDLLATLREVFAAHARGQPLQRRPGATAARRRAPPSSRAGAAPARGRPAS